MNYKTTLSGLICILLLGLNTLAANDDPCNATEIAVTTSCSSTTFSNATATNTVSVPDPGCAGYSGGDVWFQFTMPNYGYHTILELAAGTMTDGGMAVYSGTDCSSLTLVSCDDNSGSGNMPSITVDDGCNFEFAGQTFWVRVWENGNDNNGTFDICAYSIPTNVPAGVLACGSNLIAGNACCDALLLGAELDGYCGSTGGYTDEPDEIPNFCAFIDNNAWLAFVASDTDVNISIVSSGCSGGDGIQVAILGTTDCTNFDVLSNCWNPGAEASGNLIAGGLIVGETYYIMVDGWAGDECDYTLGIVSGVQTVTVSVDDDQICEGESTQLHADVVGLGPYTYTWAPAASLDDPTSPNPIATPTVSTTYTVTITGITDNIHTASVTVYPNAPDQPVVIGPSSICQNATGVVYTTSITNTSDYNWVATGSATITGGNGTDSVFVDWGTSGGSICLTAENNCGFSPQECVIVTTTTQPDITATDPSAACAPDDFDLNSIMVSNSGGGGGLPTYYDNIGDATAGTNDIFPPSTSTSGTYYVRIESGPDCYDIDSVEVEIEDPQLVIVNPGIMCSPSTVDLSTLTINEVNGFSGGTKTYFADSLDAVNNVDELSSTVVSLGGVYWVRYDTPGGCYEVGAINVVIDITPDITITVPAPLCPGGSIDLDTITINDAAGATFVKTFHSSSFLASLDLLPFANTVVSIPTTYYLRAETTNNCFQVIEIVITAGVTPDGAITGGGTFCQGQDADITFTLNGGGPFDVVYTDGTSNFSLNGISNNHVEAITVSTDSSFSLVSVADANGCSGSLLGSAVNITANPAPTGVISGDATVCNSGMVDIDFAFTGSGPFDIEYSDGMNTFPLADLPANHTLSLNVNANTTFSLVSLTDGGSCPGTVSGSAAITIAQPLSISNEAESCDASFTMYTVSFEISGGDLSTYMVTGGAGSLVGNVFTSDPIASGTAYSFTVSDNSGCPSEVVSGSLNCACATDAGTMDLNTIEVCEDEIAIATFITGSNTLNPGDLFRYVLHDNAGATMGTPIAFSDTPEFGIGTGIVLGNTYYISPIAGPNDGTGQVDFAHVCYSISPGTPVVFYELPEASISGTATICDGASTNLTFNFAAGTGPFDLVVLPSVGPSFTIENVSDNDTHSVSPSETTTYSLSSVVDNTGAQCAGTVSGSAVVTVLETIQISNIVENCDASFTMYSVSFEISGGDASAYVVSGGAGTLTGNTFTSDPIASGATYNFDVSDGTACPSQNVNGTHECICTTDAGTMNLTTVNACEDETAIAVFNSGSNTINTGDVFQYVLHDNAGATLGNEIERSTNPEFTFLPGMVLGTTYYISPIAGPDNGSGNADENHLCFSIGAGTPVVFYELPTASISGDAEICAGGSTDLVFNFSTGVGPYEVIIEDQNSNATTIPGLIDGGIFSVSPATASNYTIVNVTDSSPAVCSGSGSGTVTITVNEAPQVSNISFVCNNINTQYQVSFEISGGDPTTYIVSGGTGTLTGNTFTSDLINSGVAYSFQVDDGNNCGPVLVDGNHACDCTSNAGEMDLTIIEICEGQTASAQHITTDLNLDGNDVLGFVLYDETMPLPGSIILMNSTPDFDFDASELTYGITYHIAAIVANDSGTGFPVTDDSIDPCRSISNGQPVVFIQEPEVSITGDAMICQGDSTDIIFAFIGTGPFDVTYNDGLNDQIISGISDGHVLRVGPTMTTTYTLVSVVLSNSPFCNGTIDPINNGATIDVIELPEVTNLVSECNQQGTSYTISFEITGGNAAAYNVNGDPGSLTGNIFVSDPLAGGSTYNFQVDDGSGCPPVVLSATEYCNCTPDIKPVISLDQSISCFGLSDGILNVTNANGEAPFNFEWSSGAIGEAAMDLATGWQTVTMTDGNNCVSVDSVFLDEPLSIQADVTITPLICNGDDEGEILFSNVQGGSGGYTYSLDYYTTFIGDTFYDLPAGIYEATIEDADGCTWVDSIEIFDPAELVVDIGEDMTVELGDSILIIPNVSMAIDSFTWRSGGTLECGDCWEQMIHPLESNVYSLLVTNDEGCFARDEIEITVTKDRPFFIPNIFTPNGDGDNDILRMYSGGGIEIVQEFRIFDRWGALVFEAQNVIPGIDDFGWDGKLKGEDLVQGVYVYFLKVIFSDGTSELITGDVTIIR